MASWADELNNAVMEFKSIHGYFPNIMLANTLTYNRIDLVANTNPQRIKGELQNSPDEFVGLTGFQGNGYSLDWCLEETLKDLEYRLIYDSDPDGGLPIPEESNINNKKQIAG